MELLRFTTAGSVDDGKSTLIGRILYETGNIKKDILQTVYLNSAEEEINLAYITDGLRSEREQGITIDVAYKYFNTTSRKYIITDAPGHFQYVKNMITGASNVDVMIILIDAKNGITEQTKRHLLAAAFLGIKKISVAINKMDAVDYNELVYNKIKTAFACLCATLHINTPVFIPISALYGDNIAKPSSNMRWYQGTLLLEFLENINKPSYNRISNVRFVVQGLLHTGSTIGYLGKLINGSISVGDNVVTSTGEQLRVSNIYCGYHEANSIEVGQNSCLYFEQNPSSIRRGEVFSQLGNLPFFETNLSIDLCWLDKESDLRAHNNYYVRLHTAETTGRVTSITHKINPGSFIAESTEVLRENDFGRLNINLSEPIAWDAFNDVAATGRGILIDKETNATVAAFTISGTVAAQ